MVRGVGVEREWLERDRRRRDRLRAAKPRRDVGRNGRRAGAQLDAEDAGRVIVPGRTGRIGCRFDVAGLHAGAGFEPGIRQRHQYRSSRIQLQEEKGTGPNFGVPTECVHAVSTLARRGARVNAAPLPTRDAREHVRPAALHELAQPFAVSELVATEVASATASASGSVSYADTRRGQRLQNRLTEKPSKSPAAQFTRTSGRPRIHASTPKPSVNSELPVKMTVGCTYGVR